MQQFVPKIRGFSLDEINFPQLIQYAGMSFLFGYFADGETCSNAF
jgi:hypothetical protein